MRKLLLSVAATVGLTLTASTASALCPGNPEFGGWNNVDNNTGSITRVEMASFCSGGEGENPIRNSGWTIRLWGACSPTDCAWGNVRAERLDNGWIFGRIDQGFAKREIWAKMQGGKLRVYIRTDFTDPARPDYNSDNYFNRS